MARVTAPPSGNGQLGLCWTQTCNRFGEYCARERLAQTNSSAFCKGNGTRAVVAFRVHRKSSPFVVTAIGGTEYCHTAKTAIEVQDRQIQFVSSAEDNLPHGVETSCDENDGSRPQERFFQHSIKAAIARVEENKSWFHRSLCRNQLALVGSGSLKDSSVWADRLPVTSSFFSI